MFGTYLINYHLRSADHLDRERIAQIWHTSASLPDVGPPIMPSYAALRKRVDEEFDSGWEVTVVDTDGEVVGFLAIRPKDKVLSELFLSPEMLGRGLGKVLLDHAKSAMPDGFTLFTTSRNQKAREFYEREGLIPFREGPHPRSGHAVTYYRWIAH